MSEHTRRVFLHGAGLTAAAVTAAAVVPGAAMAATRPPATSHQDTSNTNASNTDVANTDAATTSVIVYVQDSTKGRISVMSGDREVIVTDRKLAQRLARMAD